MDAIGYIESILGRRLTSWQRQVIEGIATMRRQPAPHRVIRAPGKSRWPPAPPVGGTRRSREARCPRPWVHVPEDGRGPRDVAVDGVPVTRVVYADTRRGIVRAYREPLTLDKRRKRALTYTLRGRVTVTPAGQQEPPSTPRAGSGSTAGCGEAGRAVEGRGGSEAGQGRVAPISATSDVPRGTEAWNGQGAVESSTFSSAGTSPQLFNHGREMEHGGGA